MQASSDNRYLLSCPSIWDLKSSWPAAVNQYGVKFFHTVYIWLWFLGWVRELLPIFLFTVDRSVFIWICKYMYINTQTCIAYFCVYILYIYRSFHVIPKRGVHHFPFIDFHEILCKTFQKSPKVCFGKLLFYWLILHIMKVILTIRAQLGAVCHPGTRWSYPLGPGTGSVYYSALLYVWKIVYWEETSTDK